MSGSSSSRQILKELLQGNAASRPLFVPIVFALGARVENLPLRAFLSNPTKISNSLRQMRSRLQLECVSCYFDPFLEAEALGGTLEWPSEQGAAIVRWPASSGKGQVPSGLRSPEDVVKTGRIPVALEVIQRLKTVLREDALLMAGVSGPFSLAEQLRNTQAPSRRNTGESSDWALEIATAAATEVCKAFAEAGANLLFFRENTLGLDQPGVFERWVAELTPIFNIIRFYEALPVLQIADERFFIANAATILHNFQGCVVCASPGTLATYVTQQSRISESAALGISLPSSVFQEEQTGDTDTSGILNRLISDLRPALITTAEDVPASADLKRLAVFSALARS